jgi:hypothetical protein
MQWLGCPDMKTWYACNILENGRQVDNSWSVSYTMYLLLKYASHINVVVCTSMNLIQHVYTYNFKGGDRVMAALGVPGQDRQSAPPWDEIAEFEYLQSCGTTEDFWRWWSGCTLGEPTQVSVATRER